MTAADGYIVNGYIVNGYESNFSRAAAQVLEHLSARSGLSSWAVCRHDAHGSRTLAAVDPSGQLRAHQPIPVSLGADAVQRIGAPIALPDGTPFGELIGYGDYLAEATRDQLAAAVRLYASLLGGLAASERALAHDRLRPANAEPTTDPLTGLAARQDWEERLQTEEAYCRDFGESASVIVIELTGLRANNEVRGHAAGDDELRKAGAVVREVMAGQHFSARLSGDSFAVLVLGLNTDEIVNALRQGFTRIGTTVSIGVGARRDDGTLDEAQAQALALIAATIQRTATFQPPSIGTAAAPPPSPQVREVPAPEVPVPEMPAKSTEALAVARALAQGDINAYFQPIVDLRTGNVMAVEALARWQTPEGVHGPEKFLPLLCQAGLLGALFDHILDDGLSKLVELRRNSASLRLAVNLEFDSKAESTLFEEVRRSLDKYQLPPDALSLELSERQTFEISPAVRSDLTAVADLGVQLMLDDFGSGFASLETLTSLPISGVKLDRKFTSQVLDGEREGVVVKAMIALAAEAGLSVIAEGIETQLQSDRLVRMGCTLGQGYFFAMPQPASVVAAAIAAPLVTTF